MTCFCKTQFGKKQTSIDYYKVINSSMVLFVLLQPHSSIITELNEEAAIRPVPFSKSTGLHITNWASAAGEGVRSPIVGTLRGRWQEWGWSVGCQGNGRNPGHFLSHSLWWEFIPSTQPPTSDKFVLDTHSLVPGHVQRIFSFSWSISVHQSLIRNGLSERWLSGSHS